MGCKSDRTTRVANPPNLGASVNDYPIEDTEAKPNSTVTFVT